MSWTENSRRIWYKRWKNGPSRWRKQPKQRAEGELRPSMPLSQLCESPQNSLERLALPGPMSWICSVPSVCRAPLCILYLINTDYRNNT